MWQLELLSQVVPAFGVLTKKFAEAEVDGTRLRRDAQDCYADMVNIGLAIYMSGGEWALGLDNTEAARLLIAKLLLALETRFRTGIFAVPRVRQTDSLDPSDPTQFPQLNALASRLKSIGLGGYDECCEMQYMPQAKRQQYVSIIGRNLSLFHKIEKRDQGKRKKFIKRIHEGGEHLLGIYCGDNFEPDVESFSLSQHPSHGMKDFADRVYTTLERHWRCKCPQRAALPAGVREARLSLIRHRQLAPKTANRTKIGVQQIPTRFEVLLPACEDRVEWKVTNVEIKSSAFNVATQVQRELVNNNVCQYLRDSGTASQIDFLIENDKFWHMKPKPLVDGINCLTNMESLQQLLGTGHEIPYISRCNPRDQLILCYILANSMLYLYPSSWLQMEWSSNMVYFLRKSNDSTSPMLTFPYMAVELLGDKQPKAPAHHMQYHNHHAILALGIIFLEIITGTRFKKSHEERPWQKPTAENDDDAWRLFNKDNDEALRLFNSLEEDQRKGIKRISAGLRKAAHACLRLEPPPTFPSNQLTEEGPIRHYILSCIVWPLAHELQHGYNISLDNLHKSLVPDTREEDLHDRKVLKCFNRLSTASINHSVTVNQKINELNFTHNRQTKSSFTEHREACIYRDREEEAVDEKKVKAATTWFDWHNDALARLNQLRNPETSDSQPVKIAILDSGIELSQDSIDMYDTKPKIIYRDWVDRKTEWKDQAGHGTHLAILMRKIAPNAMVHVARVFKKKPTKKSASCIAEAIRYAVDEWGVDIIVMSFGFGEEHEELDEAIQHAAFKKVLMFAAASNDGKNRPDGVAWPAKDSNVICVHSGDGDGTHSTFTPSPQDSMRVMVLGECVNSAWPSHLNCVENHRLMSGTSCAAPIAAGIAAVILDYARGFLSEVEWRKLRRITPMRRMFERMRDQHSMDGYWWIKHWQWFESSKSEGWIQGEIRGVL